jgi:hypothetical protein
VDTEPLKPVIPLHPKRLAKLPQDLLNRLHQAVVELDRSRTNALIEQITETDASIGIAFNALAKKLDYGRLLYLLEQKEVHGN